VTNASGPTVGDSADFRRVFGYLPTGVVVVTGLGANAEPHGITIGSFASISLQPPLAGFFIGRSSRTWPLIAASGKFCANVLAASQGDLCWRFAKESTEGSRFSDIEVGVSANGSPVLPRVLATIDCNVHETFAVGDHDLVVGNVTELRVLDASQPAMVFFKGKTGNAHIAG
jgi:flavin reductase (DIM6/NTAB) family NADH-FMN oxidoreductase RutF